MQKKNIFLTKTKTKKKKKKIDKSNKRVRLKDEIKMYK